MYLEAGLLTRRSVRQFEKGRKIAKEDMNDVLKIAMYAPSACNKQPWEFVVIENEAMKTKIAELHPYAKFLSDASAAIVVCGNEREECAPGHWITDTSAAIENLLLALHGKGMGGCWCGIFPDAKRMKDFQELLNLPEYVKPNALVVAGYPLTQSTQPKDRFNSDKVHYENW